MILAKCQGHRHKARSSLAESSTIVPESSWGCGYMFMLDYDEKEVISGLQRLLDTSRETTWPELASFITKYFDWID